MQNFWSIGQKYLFTIVALLAVATIVSAKAPKRPESYNYQRGVQALYDENFDEAVTYLNKEINDNSKNGYAYAWLSAVRANQSEYGKALSNANYALQYLPKADKVYVAWAHRLRADAYLALEDTTKAIADYSAAIKLEPTNEDYNEYQKINIIALFVCIYGKFSLTLRPILVECIGTD